MSKKWTVYIHTNKINGKVYIGQTCQDCKQRWKNGYGYKPKKGSSHFYNAIIKYGWNNFEHDIIATNLTQEEADNLEITLIEKFDTMNPSKGYNADSGGKNKQPSEATRQKMRESHLGKPVFANTPENLAKRVEKTKGKKRPEVTGANSGRALKVAQYDLSGNFIRIWDYIKQASTELHIDSSSITKCCKGKLNKVGGFIWRYANE